MYESSSEVKFIAVDGVKPSKTTIADDTYPLISSTYALFTDKAPANVKAFVNWAASYEGQMCALENGYLPVKDVEIPDHLKPYTKSGTGYIKDKDYKPDYLRSYLTGEIKQNERVNFLTDKKVENKINKDIEEILDIREFNPAFHDYVEKHYILMNGYMSVIIMVNDYNNKSLEKNIKCLNYDLRNGRRINRFTDLFYKDTVFFTYLNDAVKDEIKPYSGYGFEKTDFTGLMGEIENFSITKLYFPDDNPYFNYSADIEYYHSYYLPDLMITGKFCDMSKMLDFSVLEKEPDSINQQFRNEWLLDQAKNEEGYKYTRVMDSVFHSKDEISEFRKVYQKITEDLKISTRSISSVNNDKRSYQNTTLNVLVDTTSYTKKNMFDMHGNRIYFSDIFGSEFSWINDSLLNINYISLNASEVSVTVKDEENQNTQRIIEFDPENINMDYIIPGKEKATARDTRTRTLTVPADKVCSIYSSSYILDYGKTEVTGELGSGTKVKVKRSALSHNESWYECVDAETGEYYGWVNYHEIL